MKTPIFSSIIHHFEWISMINIIRNNGIWWVQWRNFFFGNQWAFRLVQENEGQLNTPAKHDINVIPAWLAGYSGRGVTIMIVDDGLDHEHPELAERYVSRKNSGSFLLDWFQWERREVLKFLSFGCGRELVLLSFFSSSFVRLASSVQLWFEWFKRYGTWSTTTNLW